MKRRRAGALRSLLMNRVMAVATRAPISTNPVCRAVGIHFIRNICNIQRGIFWEIGRRCETYSWHAARQGESFTVQQPASRKRRLGKMPQTSASAVRDLLERWAAAVRAKNMSE